MATQKPYTVYYDATCPTCNVYKNNEVNWESNAEYKGAEGSTREIIVEHAGKTLGGVDAIAFIEEQRGHRMIAKTLRFWPLRPLFSLGYRIVARYRRVITGPDALFFWLKTCLGLGILASSLVAWRLFSGVHSVPLSPLLGSVGGWLGNASPFLAVAYALLLLTLICTRRHTRLITVVLIMISALLVIGDVNRLRPWLYQFLLLLGVLSVVKPKPTVPHSFLIGLSAMYVWGGIHKINSFFLDQIFPWFISPITEMVPIRPEMVTILAIGLIGMEISIGFLLFTRYRILGAILATVLHVTNAVLLPFAHHWGYAVLFWNLALIPIVWLVVAHNREIRNRVLYGVALLIFAVLPVFNLFGVWDNYLSFVLYARETDPGYIAINARDVPNLPAGVVVEPWPHDDRVAINTLQWAFTAYRSGLYTSDRPYVDVLAGICKSAYYKSDVSLYLREKKGRLIPIPGRAITCNALQK